MGKMECPKENFKAVIALEVFIDKKGFDPSDPIGYLKSLRSAPMLQLAFICLKQRKISYCVVMNLRKRYLFSVVL
jgi:hypothetical protein